MKLKYIFVSGGVISGVGKGVVSASIASLLQWAGYRVTSVKCENYLNIDAGTINPIEHGDPFLCEDGTEADMDIGTYEKFLDKNLGRANFITMGQIYKTVIDRERRFEYQGEDVEAIPYITDEMQRRWEAVGAAENAEVVVVELGGTTGEYQNIFYYEASRILELKHPGKVLHVHVGYMPAPAHLGEPKTKPIQLSVRTLSSMGIQPDFIIARSDRVLDKRRKERFALFCNVLPEDIISAPDVDNIYTVPLLLQKQRLDARILEKFGLAKKQDGSATWKTFIHQVDKIKKGNRLVTIGIVGKYFATGEYQLRDSYAALFDALQHATWYHGYRVKTVWIDAEQVERDGVEKHIHGLDGLVVPIGWGPRGAEGMIAAASYARRKKLPYLGLCYGMQLAVVAFARDVLGLKDANTTEVAPQTKHPVIHLIAGQKKLLERRAYGGTMRLGAWEAYLKPGTIVARAYERNGRFLDREKHLISERHRHRYEFNSAYAPLFEKNGLTISARSKLERLVEIIELAQKDHPFYVGIQGHPEYKSRPLQPHPLFVAFMAAAIGSRCNGAAESDDLKVQSASRDGGG
ncbi:CTP synthase [Patescibacteria group bacterium]|nr:CTP synthase [Patescibacteria group bacterium]MCL5091330.1 CTP synthase [Patescibacteria group bacterium]